MIQHHLNRHEQCNRIAKGMRLHYDRNTSCESEQVMARALEVESTLTDRYQTTVPEIVRRALQLNKRDKIHYSIRPSGEVVLTRADTPEDDPAIGQFLSFLAHDIATNPQHLQAIDSNLAARIHSLVGSIEIDLDAPLSADDE